MNARERADVATANATADREAAAIDPRYAHALRGISRACASTDDSETFHRFPVPAVRTPLAKRRHCRFCKTLYPFYYVSPETSVCEDCRLAKLTGPRRNIPPCDKAKPALLIADLVGERPALADRLTSRQRRLVALLMSGHTPGNAGKSIGMKPAAASRLMGRILARLQNVNISEQAVASDTFDVEVAA